MTKERRVFMVIGVLSFVMVIFLFGTLSYFNMKEIELASERCYEIGGTPTVNQDFLAINYSFSCKN